LLTDLKLVELRKKYSKLFPGADIHHMTPKSRNGGASEFNLFPFKERAHSDYHFIFWNLTINEVWEMLEQIHDSIFQTEENYIIPWWYKYCELEKGGWKQKASFEKDKRERLKKHVSVSILRRNWIGVFGGEELITARALMKVMFLFEIFGTKVTDKNTLFNNGYLEKFFENSPCSKKRLQAFQICFGRGGRVQAMKSKIARILNKNSFYSP
jgi:hypothetical protein